jgi:hypothetical protein
VKSRSSSLIRAGVHRRHFLGSLGFGTIALLFPTRGFAGLLAAGNTVSLRCLGPNLPMRFLEGRNADGSVGLVNRLNVKKDSGTRWRVVRRGERLVALKCLGVANAPRWLEGRPSASAVGLTTTAKQPPDSSTWRTVQADSENEDIVALECIVAKNSSRWLEARASNGTVGLAAGVNAPPGGRWEVRIHPVSIDGGTRLNPADK